MRRKYSCANFVTDSMSGLQGVEVGGQNSMSHTMSARNKTSKIKLTEPTQPGNK